MGFIIKARRAGSTNAQAMFTPGLDAQNLSFKSPFDGVSVLN
jgi:hypothetical protein